MSGKKLSRASKGRLNRMLESIENTNVSLDGISPDDLEDLVRRDAIGISPLGIESSGESIGIRAGGGISSPVERAVLARDSGKTPRDPVRGSVRKIEKDLLWAEQALARVVEEIHFLKYGVEKKRARDTSTPCDICLLLPASRNGMCVDDYTEWVEHGSPDRLRWKAWKTGAKSSDGRILVANQPPSTRIPTKQVEILDNSGGA